MNEFLLIYSIFSVFSIHCNFSCEKKWIFLFLIVCLNLLYQIRPPDIGRGAQVGPDSPGPIAQGVNNQEGGQYPRWGVSMRMRTSHLVQIIITPKKLPLCPGCGDTGQSTYMENTVLWNTNMLGRKFEKWSKRNCTTLDYFTLSSKNNKWLYT